MNPTIPTLLTSVRALDAASSNGGAVSANGTAVVSKSGAPQVTTITLTALVIAMADAAGVVAFGSKKILDFPEGYIRIDSVVADLAVTKSSAGVNATFNGDFSVGTAPAAGDATLTATEADIIASAATPAAVAGATTAIGSKLTVSDLNGTVTARDMFLNVLVDDADHDVTTTPCNLLFTGTVTVTWRKMG